MSGREWTEDEVAILMSDSTDGIPRAVTAARLKRSLGAVKSKAVEKQLIVNKVRSSGTEERLRERWRELMPAMKQALRYALQNDISVNG